MSKKTRFTTTVISLLALATLGLATLIQHATTAKNFMSGAVYVLTNQSPSNAVAVFNRAASGTLTPAGMFLTGGSGNPVGVPPPDPLGSQGALILSEGNHLLFAVNAGSHEISVLAVGPNELTLVDKVASGGLRPISLTNDKDLLYVLNEGEGGIPPNITGFTVSPNGKLSPLAGSTRPLSGGSAADPAQIAFNPDGRVLVVTEKQTNLIDTYTVGDDGLASGPTPHASNGATPFGFDFDNRGNLIVSEAFGGAPNQSAMSSYRVSADGSLSVVSGSVRDFQTAACWVVVTNNSRFAYTSNTGSGSISSYHIRPDGTLTLLNSVAGNTGPGSSPIDMALTNSSRFLYVYNGGFGTIGAFRVEADGSLTPIPGAGGIPFGAQGIAAR
jgi:6-phosphogluconolactonase